METRNFIVHAKIGRFEMEVDVLKKVEGAGTFAERNAMIERNHKGLNMSKQAEVLPTSLSEIYYNSKDKIDN